MMVDVFISGWFCGVHFWPRSCEPLQGDQESTLGRGSLGLTEVQVGVSYDGSDSEVGHASAAGFRLE